MMMAMTMMAKIMVMMMMMMERMIVMMMMERMIVMMEIMNMAMTAGMLQGAAITALFPTPALGLEQKKFWTKVVFLAYNFYPKTSSALCRGIGLNLFGMATLHTKLYQVFMGNLFWPDLVDFQI